jgi:hypothetical protein
MQNRAFSVIEQVSCHGIARNSLFERPPFDLLPILPVYSVTHQPGSDLRATFSPRGEGAPPPGMVQHRTRRASGSLASRQGGDLGS